MKMDILDPHVGPTMNVFLVLANVINVLYNLPQVYRTYKRKTTGDLSSWFLFLRMLCNFIWIAYAIETDSFPLLLNNTVVVLSTMFISYYKILEVYQVDQPVMYDAILLKDPQQVEET